MQLILRSLNTSKSAFASITFNSGFFDSHAIFNSRDVKSSILIKVSKVKQQQAQKELQELALCLCKEEDCTLCSWNTAFAL